MIQKAISYTRATSTNLRENITNLDTYISTVNSNIGNFNQYVKVNVDGLKERGEHTDDLMINLFNAYKVTPNGKFVRYKKTKRDKYDDIYNIT